MKRDKLLLCMLMFLYYSAVIAQTPGYYKDIFVDGGAHLTSMIEFPAAEALGLGVEYLSTDDVGSQNQVMVYSTDDSNGRLLYPDGEPRFKLLYTNGGSSTNHGNSLGAVGRSRVRAFYANGGSFMGSCAGAFISSVHWDSTGQNDAYYHIWPGRTGRTRLSDSYTDHDIPNDSPLLNYSDFGNDLKIANVRHNGGCWAREDLDFPKHTEILARYSIPSRPEMHGKASTWAYKPDEKSGRIVVIGSHPEFAASGEIFELTDAMLRYALDGIGELQVKAALINGETRVMDKYWEEEDPEFARIGDKQYHHFTLDVPLHARSVVVELDAEDDFDFNLYVQPGSFAFEGRTRFFSIGGADHSLEVSTADFSGFREWYVAVECATTINSAGHIYWGKTEVLNGISYSITATWDTTAVVDIADAEVQPSEFKLHQNYPNPFNPSTMITYSIPDLPDVNLTIYDASGRIVLTHNELQNQAGDYTYSWNGVNTERVRVPTGVYFARLEAAEFSQTIKMLFLK